MKKLICIALIFTMALSFFAACGGEETVKDNSAISNTESAETEEESASSEDAFSEDSADESSEEEGEEDAALTVEGFFELCGQSYVSTEATLPAYFTATDTAHLYSVKLTLPEVEGMGTHISGDNLFINYWDEEDKGVIYSLKTGKPLVDFQMPYWYSVGTLEDSGFWVVDKSSLRVTLYDAEGNERIAYEGKEADGQVMAVSEVCVSGDGRFMFCFSDDKSATLVDLEKDSEKAVELNTDASAWGITYLNDRFVLSMFNDSFIFYNPYEDKAESFVPDSMCSVNDGVLDYSDTGFMLLGSFEDNKKLFMELDNTEYMQTVYGGYIAVGSSYNTGTVKVYDLVKGKQVSTLSFGDEVYGTNLVFREDGTLFMVISSEKGNELYVYDVVSASREANEDISYLFCTDEEIERLTAELAEEIYNTMGVELVYGSEGNDFIISDYVAQPETDMYTVYLSVNTIRDTLALYPEGMIKEAWEGGYSGIKMYLCGTIYGVGGDSLGEAGAFVSDSGSYIVMVLDVTEDLATNIPHELSHVFDRRIGDVSAENAMDWLLIWEGTAPGEDAYTFMYTDYESNMRYTVYGEDNTHNVWFIDGYSRVSPTEDRARIMEYLFFREEGTINEVFEHENIKNKAVLYSYILRQCFPSCAEADDLYWEEDLGTVDESIMEILGVGVGVG